MGGRNVPVVLLWAASFFLVIFSQASAVRAAAEFTILNNDGPGEGLNDLTPVAPVGGNSGTTLGQQRMIALWRKPRDDCCPYWGNRAVTGPLTKRARWQTWRPPAGGKRGDL